MYCGEGENAAARPKSRLKRINVNSRARKCFEGWDAAFSLAEVIAGEFCGITEPR